MFWTSRPRSSANALHRASSLMGLDAFPSHLRLVAVRPRRSSSIGPRRGEALRWLRLDGPSRHLLARSRVLSSPQPRLLLLPEPESAHERVGIPPGPRTGRQLLQLLHIAAA